MKWLRSSELIRRQWPLAAAVPLALALLYGAFWALRLSDPGVFFLFHGQAIATSESLLRLDTEPKEVTAIVSWVESHPRVRLHLIPCPPVGWPDCTKEKPVFTVITPPSGQFSVEYPATKRIPDVGVYREPLHPLYLTFWLLFLLAFLLLYKGEARILAVAVILSCGLYFSITTGLLRGLDVRGHIAHVERIAQVGFFVPAGDCWECFQPPFYYALASAFLGFQERLLASDEIRLQALSLFFHCLSIPFIVGSLRRFTRNRRELLLYSALVCLWPGAILASVRLGNDALGNLLAFVCLYFLLEKSWRMAALAAACAFLVKNNGIVLLVLSSILIGWNHFREKIPLRTLLVCGAILISSIWADKGIKAAKDFDPSRMNDLPPELAVPGDLAHLLLPDPLAFLSQPFVNPWVSENNRNFMPNYFWKSSLFGEWSFQQPWGRELALLLSGLLLLLIALAAFAAFEIKAAATVPVLAIMLSCSAIAYFRWNHPWSDAADFRFVYAPVVLGMALLLAQARAKRSACFARMLTSGFLFISQAFFVLFWFFESR